MENAIIKYVLFNGLITDETIKKNIGSNIVLKDEFSERINDFVQNRDINIDLFKYLLYVNNKSFVLDEEQIDVKKLANILDSMLKDNTIILPWSFDNQLYNKFFQLKLTKAQNLNYENTTKLLVGTDQGVYQIGSHILGPYGILVSKEKRLVDPTRFYQLWHCEDPICNNIHFVGLNYQDSKSNNLISEVFGLNKIINDISEIIDNEIKKDRYYSNGTYWDIGYFIGSCFSSEELKVLISQILYHDGSKRSVLSEYLNCNLEYNKIFSNCKKNELLQLILLFDDDDIIYSLEQCIYCNKIVIPQFEIRKIYSGFANILNGFTRQRTECSKYGVRLFNFEEDSAVSNLFNVVKRIYEDESDRDKLKHILRDIPNVKNSKSVYEILEYSIYRNDITLLVENLLIKDYEAYKKTRNYLKIPGNIASEVDNDVLKTIILWKCGFNICEYQNEGLQIMKMTSIIEDEISLISNFNESSKSAIRGKLINLFVKLEEYLQKMLFFLTWILLSDIYKNKNVYNEHICRLTAYQELQNYKYNEDEIFTLDDKGNDTLYPLIVGFKVLLIKIENLLTLDEKIERKPSDEIPKAVISDNAHFPFKHKRLIYDLNVESIERVRQSLKDIYLNLETMQLCEIRNSTSHKRSDDKFPEPNKIAQFCKNIKGFIEESENKGYYPSIYYSKESRTDIYGRNIVSAYNSLGNKVEYLLLNDSLFPMPQFNEPQVIVGFLKIREFDGGLRLKIQQESHYLNFLKNYPIR